MARFGGVRLDAVGEPLAAAAFRALREAAERPGRSREGAFALLAADALLTYAVEEAADAPDPGRALEDLLLAVAAEGGELARSASRTRA
jgi:hypothetical protein